jgi:uncharacterized protein
MSGTQGRLPGFDLARAYAIFGMYLVNYQAIFGSWTAKDPLSRVMNLFSGNSSSAFVILAGMGCSLLTWRPDESPEEKKRLRSIVVRRSWFLFLAGLVLYTWWPADILHFYGGYMHLAALLLFLSARWLWFAGIAAVVGFHAMLLVIPYERGWNFDTLDYSGFWTINGFLRNTIYNGWNPILPWSAFFFLGMGLGRLDWNSTATWKRVAKWGVWVFGCSEALIILAANDYLPKSVAEYVAADYLPPYLIFQTATAGYALLLIPACVAIGTRWRDAAIVRALAAFGRHTLTHYVMHVTLGLFLIGALLGKRDGSDFSTTAVSDGARNVPVFAFVIAFYGASVLFSVWWAKRFKNGPLEALMRRVTG